MRNVSFANNTAVKGAGGAIYSDSASVSDIIVG